MRSIAACFCSREPSRSLFARTAPFLHLTGKRMIAAERALTVPGRGQGDSGTRFESTARTASPRFGRVRSCQLAPLVGFGHRHPNPTIVPHSLIRPSRMRDAKTADSLSKVRGLVVAGARSHRPHRRGETAACVVSGQIAGDFEGADDPSKTDTGCLRLLSRPRHGPSASSPGANHDCYDFGEARDPTAERRECASIEFRHQTGLDSNVHGRLVMGCRPGSRTTGRRRS